MKTGSWLMTARFFYQKVKSSNGAAMHILEAKGLSKHYGKRQVVKGLSLYVGSGEIVGLLGPNGAGKTTTFYMMVGLINPEEGRILLDHEDLTLLPMYRRSLLGISYLPQEPSIFRKLTVEDNLKAVFEIRGLKQDEIAVEVDDISFLTAGIIAGNHVWSKHSCGLLGSRS